MPAASFASYASLRFSSFFSSGKFTLEADAECMNYDNSQILHDFAYRRSKLAKSYATRLLTGLCRLLVVMRWHHSDAYGTVQRGVLTPSFPQEFEMRTNSIHLAMQVPNF